MARTKRTIHTNLYGSKALEMIIAFKNIAINTRYGKISRSLEETKVDQQPDGEIVLTIDNTDLWYYRKNIFYKRDTDAKAIDWLTWLIKDTVGTKLGYKNETLAEKWDRDNYEHVEWHNNSYNPVYSYHYDFTISDIYCLYEFLKNRKNMERKYTADQIALIKGTQRDPVAAEMEMARREQIEQIKTKYAELKAKANDEYYARGEEFSKKNREIREADYARLEAEMKKEMDECNQMAAFIVA